MNEKRLAIKVGAFAIVALAVLAGILMAFSKGQSWLTPGYTLRLRADNVGGLKARSSVLISGVPVGTVKGSELSPDGKGVTIYLHIQKRYVIRSDAIFNVEQIGLLGDQFVVITPTTNQGPILVDGDTVECKAPFNVQALAASAVGFIQRVDEAAKMLKQTISRINSIFLTEETLTNLSLTVGNLRSASERAVSLVDHLDHAVSSNSPAFAIALTNLTRFSEDLNRLSGDLRQTIAENRPAIAGAAKHLEESAQAIDGLIQEVEKGKGLAGALFKDDAIRANLSATLANMAIVSSNLALHGLLYKPKPPKPAVDTRPPYPGYSPAR